MLIAVAPLGVLEVAVICIFKQQITYRDMSSEPVMSWWRAGVCAEPASSLLPSQLGVAPGVAALWETSLFLHLLPCSANQEP